MIDENMWGKVLEARAQRDAIAGEAGRLREALRKMPCWCVMPIHPDASQCLRCRTLTDAAEREAQG